MHALVIRRVQHLEAFREFPKRISVRLSLACQITAIKAKYWLRYFFTETDSSLGRCQSHRQAASLQLRGLFAEMKIEPDRDKESVEHCSSSFRHKESHHRFATTGLDHRQHLKASAPPECPSRVIFATPSASRHEPDHLCRRQQDRARCPTGSHPVISRYLSAL